MARTAAARSTGTPPRKTSATSPARKTAARKAAGSKSAAPTTRRAPARRTTKKSVPDTAKAQARQGAEEVQERAGSLVRSQLDERSRQAGHQLNDTAANVREIAQQLREQDNDSAAQLADLAASRVEQVGRYLAETDPDALINDLEDLARSRPWAVAAGAAAIGFLAARSLASSSRKRHGGRYVDTDAGADFDEADAELAYPGGSPR